MSLSTKVCKRVLGSIYVSLLCDLEHNVLHGGSEKLAVNVGANG